MIQVDIYDESRLLICSEILAYGDVIALFSGGHIKIIEDANLWRLNKVHICKKKISIILN